MNSLTLEISVTPKSDGSAFIFKDITPLWDSISAPNGYDPTGVNGFDPNTISTSNIRVYVYDYGANTTTTIAIPNTVPDVSAIGGVGFIVYEITAAAIGYTSGIIPDGVYRFTYQFETTDDDPIVYTKIIYVADMSQVTCCLDEKLLEVNLCQTCKKNPFLEGLFVAKMIADIVPLALECEDYTEAQEMIEYLTDFCGDVDCGCN